jgi:hypothetical protein
LFPRKKVQTMNKVMVPKEVSLDQLLEIIAKAAFLLKHQILIFYDLSNNYFTGVFLRTIRIFIGNIIYF